MRVHAKKPGESLKTVCSKTYRRLDNLKCISQVSTDEASQEDLYRRKTASMLCKTFHSSQHWSVYMLDTNVHKNKIQKPAANSHYVTY